VNHLGAVYEQQNLPVDPSVWQLRQCAVEYGVFPLVSAFARENSPLVNSLLLYGPQGSGKTSLSRAIALAAGAAWLDISPRHVQPRLTSKAETNKLVHMIFTVAKAIQPCVIYIDDVEQLAIKGKKKDMAPGADMLGKYLAAITTHTENLGKEHRVLVIGNSRAPFNPKVSQDDLMGLFGPGCNGKALLMPNPNHALRLQLWRHFIEKQGISPSELSKHPDFSDTMLAFVSEGFSAGSILAAVRLTLPPHRVQALKEAPGRVSTSEFIDNLAKMPCMFQDEAEAMAAFTEEIMGEKKRREAVAAAAEAKASEQGKKKK